ncbi:MAG: SDR family oxidoreductase [Trueperaceae bacterium]
MDVGLGNKRALVLAATSGLGRATAAALAADGAHVALCGRDAARAAATAAAIARETGAARVVGFGADVRDADDVTRLVADTVDALGGLDVLVLNAGGPPSGGFEALDDDAWDAAYALTLMSVVRTIRVALPHLRQAGGGAILALASSSVKRPIPNLTLSNAFRPAVQALCKDLATSLAPDGIRVNVLSPGRIATDRTNELDETRAAKQGVDVETIRDASRRTIPLGRYGRVEEFGRVAAFLVSDAASYVTGQSLLVDGGLVTSL